MLLLQLGAFGQDGIPMGRPTGLPPERLMGRPIMGRPRGRPMEFPVDVPW